MEKGTELIMGLWKFIDHVGEKDLIEVANEWAEDQNYKLLYIRKTSKDQLGIGFAYVSDGSKEAYNDYFDRTSDGLKRKFGNDLVGWDISSRATVIKGF